MVVQNLSAARLKNLSRDPAFVADLTRLTDAVREYQSRPRWGDQVFPGGVGTEGIGHASEVAPDVAYFSMEFGLGAALPLYAGGLGILAGDYLKAASDLGVPLVGVSLMYHEGYFRQSFDANGNQQEIFAYIDSRNVPIQPYSPGENGWLRIPIEFPGRKVYFRVWEARVGRVRLYLLDSNDPMNSPRDQGITSRLYGGSAEERLMQAIALGVGGWRLIETLPQPVSVLHLNEGHAAFATIERARHRMERDGISFWEALWATRGGNLFTTHTPLPAAFDVYPAALLAKYHWAYAPELHISADELAALGGSDASSNGGDFNMAFLAMRTCARANAVSALHGRVSRHIFRDLYPRWPESEVPVGHVTNGVHVPSWDSPWSDHIWTEACGKNRWRCPDTDLSDEISGVDDAALWEARGRERADLVTYVRRRLARQLAMQAVEPEDVRQATAALDPNVLTLGFARRFTGYKRPNLLLTDPDRFAAILTHRDRPTQLIIAGKAHPHDEAGKQLVRRWIDFSKRPDVHGHVVFLHDYDIALAQELVQGVDLWLNTPLRPWEACGTSGMKVLVNGGLNLSTLDGWWAEAYQPEYGWAIGPGPETDIEDAMHTGAAAAHADQEDAEAVYALLDEVVIPEFYRRNPQGIPEAWVSRIRRTMTDLVPRFSANRMMREYTERYYLPAMQDFKTRGADGAAHARSLAEWSARLRRHWVNVHWGSFTLDRSDAGTGAAVQVYLGDIEPDDVCVQLYADAAAGQPRYCETMARAEAVPGAKNGFVYRLSLQTDRPPEHFTPRLVADPGLASVPMESPLIAWWHGDARPVS